ncbi:hypothetical protein M3Y94_01168500 [Aphelenchoides besseyi]|nr:hypothetical protein M3Y94_01168500 [Aphelenchoides besseyi]KAI6228127.1 hypothetical protein M3Y95_00589600 [Aphelenchoides besseyi]
MSKKPDEQPSKTSEVYTQLLAVATASKNGEKMDPTVPPMNEENRQWLESALKEMSQYSDPVRNLKAAISRLKRTGEGDDLEELQRSVDALIDLVCDLDLALDFCKLEGLKIVEELLSKFSDSINQRVIPIISEISQNNPSVQQQVLKTKLFENLLLLLDESSGTTSAITRLKIVGAISAIVKQYPPAVIRFIQLGGLETVMQTFDSAIKNGDARLVLRCVVMVVNSKRSAAPELLKRLSINPEVYYERMRSALKSSGESDKYNEALEYLESDPV